MSHQIYHFETWFHKPNDTQLPYFPRGSLTMDHILLSSSACNFSYISCFQIGIECASLKFFFFVGSWAEDNEVKNAKWDEDTLEYDK